MDLSSMNNEGFGLSSTHSTTPPLSIDKLKEEFSCSICLDIFFEPTTTFCGHTFCSKCFLSSIDKNTLDFTCPLCRQHIRIEESCKVNIVLWNTIQKLFPHDVEAKKAIIASEEAQNMEICGENTPNSLRLTSVENMPMDFYPDLVALLRRLEGIGYQPPSHFFGA